MAEPSKDNDQSMEDILQSIKRIIADEGDAPPAAAGSDVLELTELLAEDVAVPPAAAEPVEEPAPAVESMSIDEIMATPVSHAPQEPVAAPAPAPAPVVAAPAPVPAPVAAAPAPVAAEDNLISESTLAASMAALNKLAQAPTSPQTRPSAAFRSGTTVEDLVLESLRPMLKEWLDGNLPSLVRTLVEREVRRISGQ